MIRGLRKPSGSHSGVFKDRGARFLAWPGRSVFKTSAAYSACFFVIFYAVYGLTDYITGLHAHRVDIHFDWEMKTPLVPAMSVFYASIIPAFLLTPFIVRDPARFRTLFRLLVIETSVAAAFFLLLPVANVFPVSQVSGPFSPLYHFMDKVNLTYNELPSLHVAFACTLAAVFGGRCGATGRAAIYVWALMVCLSTLLTHQHHVLSVASGIALSLVCLRLKGKTLLEK